MTSCYLIDPDLDKHMYPRYYKFSTVLLTSKNIFYCPVLKSSNSIGCCDKICNY